MISWLAQCFSGPDGPEGKKEKKKRVFALSLFLFPVLLLGVGHFYLVYSALTELSFERRQSVAISTAFALNERLDSILKEGITFSVHPQTREAVEEGRWDDAIETMELFKKATDEAFIDRIFLAEPNGVLRAGIPEKGTEGQDFSFRDWYQGVTSTGKPYVSRAYQRTVEPRYRVVTAAIPILDDRGAIMGILALQIRLDRFLEWAETVDAGPGGLVYIVDQEGNIVSHPELEPQAAIVNASSTPVIQSLLGGKHGVLETHDILKQREKVVTAYEPVKKYGWGVAIEQASTEVFSERDKELVVHLAVYVLLFLFNLMLMLSVLHVVKRAEPYSKKRKAENRQY